MIVILWKKRNCFPHAYPYLSKVYCLFIHRICVEPESQEGLAVTTGILLTTFGDEMQLD